MTNYSTGDFLIKIKNTAMAKNKEVTFLSNKKVKAVADALKKLGFLDEVKVNKSILTATLTFKDKRPRLMDLKLVTKPGLRIYMGARELEKIKGPSTFLLSTPKGILSAREAIKQRMGGEVIVEVL